MIIDCISDLHGCFPDMEGGDLLIVAGDLTSNDKAPAWKNFYDWFEKQNYRKKVYIAGNHDGFLKDCLNSTQQREFSEETGLCKPDPDSPSEYLCDSGTEFEGLKIWGSPWTPTFCNWYFMKNRGADIKEKWDLIPNDIDILITHGPPHGILDQPKNHSRAYHHCGCEELLEAVKRVKPKIHVFGHIHGGYGEDADQWGLDGPITKYVNAAHMDEDYEPVNKPIRVVL